jgi:hypothetical protein
MANNQKRNNYSCCSNLTVFCISIVLIILSAIIVNMNTNESKPKHSTIVFAAIILSISCMSALISLYKLITWIIKNAMHKNVMHINY